MNNFKLFIYENKLNFFKKLFIFSSYLNTKNGRYSLKRLVGTFATRVMRGALTHLTLRFTLVLRGRRPLLQTLLHTIQYSACTCGAGFSHDALNIPKKSWNNALSTGSLKCNCGIDACSAMLLAGADTGHFTVCTGLTDPSGAGVSKQRRQWWDQCRLCPSRTSTLLVRQPRALPTCIRGSNY